MHKLLFFFSIATLSFSAFPLEIKVALWEKEICEAQQLCLPTALGESKLVTVPEPANNSFSRVMTSFGNYSVIFTFTKRTEPEGYYSFQTEIGDQQNPIIALCSRFEGLDTVENAMVGACAGKIPIKNKLIGVSLQLPR